MKVIKTYEELNFKSPKQIIKSLLSINDDDKITKELNSIKHEYIESIGEFKDREIEIKLKTDLIKNCFTDKVNLRDIIDGAELSLIFREDRVIPIFVLRTKENIARYFNILPGTYNSITINNRSIMVSFRYQEFDIKNLTTLFNKIPALLNGIVMKIELLQEEEKIKQEEEKMLNFLKSKHEEIEDCLLDLIDMDRNYIKTVDSHGVVEYKFNIVGIDFKPHTVGRSSYSRTITEATFGLTDELISLFSTIKSIKSRVEHIIPDIEINIKFGENSVSFAFYNPKVTTRHYTY